MKAREKLLKEARANAKEKERQAAMRGDFSNASYHAGIREGIDIAADILDHTEATP